MGRQLQQAYGQEPQCIFTMPLLEGLDNLMWRWCMLLSFHSETEIAGLQQEVTSGRNPKNAKVLLANEIDARFLGAAAADAAEQDFGNRSKGGVPDEIPEVRHSGVPLSLSSTAQACGAGAVDLESGPADRR